MGKTTAEPFGYAVQIATPGEWITNVIYKKIEEAGAEAGTLAMQGESVRLKELKTPLDWIVEEAGFEQGDVEWQKSVIKSIAKMIEEEKEEK